MQNRDPQLETSGNPIGFYEREFYTFSNFSSFQVEWRGRLWPTSEHAYQAAHYFDSKPEFVELIWNMRSAHEAFKFAKAHWEEKVANWKDIKIEVMEDICRHKMQQHEYVRRKLIQSEERELVEDSPMDSFWGWGPDKQGRNELGKVWMRLRDELRQQVE